MPTFKDFRRMALGLQDVVEGAHMDHPDFRLNGRIFATLHPDLKAGMVKLTPEQQQRSVLEYPAAFAPENGAWGRQGCTKVLLHAVDKEVLGEVLTLAWQNATHKAPPRKQPSRKRASRKR